MNKVLILGSNYPEKSYYSIDNNIKLQNNNNKYYILTDSWLCSDDELTTCTVDDITKYTSTAEYYCALDPNEIRNERLDNRYELLFLKAIELIVKHKIDEVHINDIFRYGFITTILKDYCNIKLEIDISSINPAYLYNETIRAKMSKQLIKKAERVIYSNGQKDSLYNLNTNFIAKNYDHLKIYHKNKPKKLVILSSHLSKNEIEHTKYIISRLASEFEILIDCNDRCIAQLSLSELVSSRFSVVNLSPIELKSLSRDSIITTFALMCGRISHPLIYGEFTQTRWFSNYCLISEELINKETFNKVLGDYKESSFRVDGFKIMERIPSEV